jgi:Tol biopolymer transport system component
LASDALRRDARFDPDASVLRKALGDGHDGEPFIQTVPTKGYRFTAKVRVIPPADQAGAAPPEQRHSGRRPMRWPARGRTKWFVAIAGASVLALSSYVVFWRSRTTRPPPMAVPLTAYDGFALFPSISPDGRHVAFSWGKSGPGSNWDIYIKRVGPGEARRVTTSPGRDDRPAWSPDGRRLAFMRFTSGTTEDLLVVPAEVPAPGGDERKLATMTFPDSPPRVARDIAWTLDGKWIAIGGQPTQDESGGIWLIAVDRDEKRRLTESPSGYLDEKPAFSPDGKRLAFIRRRLKAPTGAALHVVPLSPDLTTSGPPIRMTSAEGLVGGHAWTPDGRGLVFSLWGISVARISTGLP